MRLTLLLVMLISTGYSADFTTYVGGSNQSPYTIGELATDSGGNTYVTGINAFVTKLDPAGNILFTTMFGQAESFSYGYAIAVDSADNIWVGGQTAAANFPLVNPLQPSVSSGSGFLVKMAPDGTVLYSTYFGGTLGQSAVSGIATDPSGNAYVTGWTNAPDFPATPGLPASFVGGGDAPVYGLFVAKLTSDGQKILYSTVLAGPQQCVFCFPVPKTSGAGIAVDASGNAIVAGSSNIQLPVVSRAGSGGAFVFKINAAGNGIVYFTYLGASGNPASSVPGSIAFGARPIAADASGNAYLTGYTNSPDFPTTPGTYQRTYSGSPEAFAMKLNPSGTTGWATFLVAISDPNQADVAIALDRSGNVWLTGANGVQSSHGPNFMAELTADGSAVPYVAQFPLGEVGQDIAIDRNGVIHLGGPIGLVSTITPTQTQGPRTLSIVNAGSGQLSGMIAPGEIVSLYGTGLGPVIPVIGSPRNGLFPTSLGGVQVLVDEKPIPLLYVSASQINAEIPSPISGLENGLADVRVVNNSVALPDFRVLAATSVFGAFYSSGAYLAVTNQDGTVNSELNPATPGSYISLWGTGLPGAAVMMDGAVATAAVNYCSSCQVTFRTYNFSATETVEYAGPSPGLIDGLMQINVLVPVQTQPTPSQTPQLQVLLGVPGASQLIFLGFVWVSH